MAELTWDQMSKTLVSETGTGSITYAFRNTGAEEVQIASVSCSCSCLRGTSSLKSVAPGQVGDIVAVFDGKSHLGSERKSIAVVSTSGTARKVDVLELRVEIRPDVFLEPKTVFWAKGEQPKPQQIRIKSSRETDGPITLTKVTGGEGHFCITRDPKNLECFSITPNNTAEAKRSLILVTARRANNTEREIVFFATVGD